MRFDGQKSVLSPQAVERLPEFAPLTTQQKTFILLVACGASILSAVKGAYNCSSSQSERCFAYDLLNRRTMKPILNRLFGQRDDNLAAFTEKLDKLVRRGSHATDAEINALVLYGSINHFLPPDFQPASFFTGADYREAKQKFEAEYLKGKLEAHGWNVSKTAAEVGLQRSSLMKKLKALGLRRPIRESK